MDSDGEMRSLCAVVRFLSTQKSRWIIKIKGKNEYLEMHTDISFYHTTAKYINNWLKTIWMKVLTCLRILHSSVVHFLLLI